MLEIDNNQHGPESDDLLWRHLKTVPAFRALLRSVEARFFQHIVLPAPVLDLGCGDGHFASMTFDSRLSVGIDPWWRPLKKATCTGAYQLCIQSLGNSMPFPDNHFGTIISNSVLEHIPDVQPVLIEASRILKPGGLLVLTFPSDNFTAKLGGATWFERAGLTALAERYRQGFNYIARHAHTDSPERWQDRLEKANFVVEKWLPYFSVRALHALEFGHLFGLPSFVCHLLTRRWIIAPWQSSLYFTERWLRPLFEEPETDEGTMLLFIARKSSSSGLRDMPAEQ